MIGLRRVRLVILVLTCLLGASVIPASPALAATTCTGAPLNGVTIQGNVSVPNGGYCELSGSTVTGNVTVGANGSFVTGTTTIQGKVSGDGVNTVILGAGAVVKGSVAVSRASNHIMIMESRVNGNVTLTGNVVSSDLVVTNSTIGGNLTILGNTSPYTFPSLYYNTVAGNLSCEGNTLPPEGDGNVVSGRMSGQCAGF